MQEENGQGHSAKETFDTRSCDFLELHHRARRLLKQYNNSASDDPARRHALLDELMGSCGKGVWVEPPFFCDYGGNIHLGTGCLHKLQLCHLGWRYSHGGRRHSSGPGCPNLRNHPPFVEQ